MKEEVQKLIDQLKELIQKEGIDPEEVVRQLVPRPEPEEMEIDPERIAAEEGEAQSYFFGEEVKFKPESFEPYLDQIKRCARFGLRPHVLLPKRFEEGATYPGWRVRLERWIYSKVEEGSLPPGTLNLSPLGDRPALVMVDPRMKPNYQGGKQMYRDDELIGGILEELRRNGVIPYRRYIDPKSRYAISWIELHQFVLPEIARAMGVRRDRIRLPRLVEFNFLSNCFYPQWYQGNTWEWFEDRVRSPIGEECLFGGKFSFAAMATSVYTNWAEARSDRIGFRPIVILGELPG
ncbi:hypothetical protein DRP77_06060 [Candidatus Poribacteria bacterium]|nr:MAG: hypothetical protein DRP77_06060 [Candidatus Poribacteria bacterium]